MHNINCSLDLRRSHIFRFYAVVLISLVLLAWFGCSSAGAPRTTPPPTATGVVPQLGHVVIVPEENTSYSSVIGNSAMPYLNSLASQYGLATQYFANTHPSIGNYFMLTTHRPDHYQRRLLHGHGE